MNNDRIDNPNPRLDRTLGKKSHNVKEFDNLIKSKSAHLRPSSPPIPTERALLQSIGSADNITREPGIKIKIGDHGKWEFIEVENSIHMSHKMKELVEKEGILALVEKLCQAEGSECLALAAKQVLAFFENNNIGMKKEEFIAELLKKQIALELPKYKSQGNLDSLLREPSLATQVFAQYQLHHLENAFDSAASLCINQLKNFREHLPLTLENKEEGKQILLWLSTVVELYLQGLIKATGSLPEELRSIYRAIEADCEKLGPGVSREQLVGLFFLRGANPFLLSGPVLEKANWATDSEEKEKVKKTLVAASRVLQWTENRVHEKAGAYLPLFEAGGGNATREEMVQEILANLIR